jgi:hypothetical protein
MGHLRAAGTHDAATDFTTADRCSASDGKMRDAAVGHRMSDYGAEMRRRTRKDDWSALTDAHEERTACSAHVRARAELTDTEYGKTWQLIEACMPRALHVWHSHRQCERGACV